MLLFSCKCQSLDANGAKRKLLIKTLFVTQFPASLLNNILLSRKVYGREREEGARKKRTQTIRRNFKRIFFPLTNSCFWTTKNYFVLHEFNFYAFANIQNTKYSIKLINLITKIPKYLRKELNGTFCMHIERIKH